MRGWDFDLTDRCFSGLNVGAQVQNYIKDWFTHPANKIGPYSYCRCSE